MKILKYPVKTFLVILMVSIFALAGCSSVTQAVYSKPKTEANIYQGKDNLTKFEKQAKENPKSTNAQIEAGKSAFVNNDYTKAADYYQKAISSDPNNVVAVNNLGNVYFRGKNDPKAALPYYQKAAQIDPTYSYSWWNLALCEQALGDNKAAKDALDNGLQKVSKSDPNYQSMKKMRSSLK